MYSSLDPDRLVATLDTLSNRIRERFPGAGLLNVCRELTVVAGRTRERLQEIARPRYGIRYAVTAVISLLVLMLLALCYAFLRSLKTGDELFETLQGIDAGFNLLVLIGASLLFIYSLEERTRRKRALTALHELRSIVHVIDMHQLTKDPSAPASVSDVTASSPKRLMTPFELSRYLDYCSELLSLAAKVAALYAQSFPDPVVVDAVSDIERLTTNLSQKIWQKIVIIESQITAAATLAAKGSANV